MRQQRERVRRIAPAQRLLVQGKHIRLASFRQRRDQCFEIGLRCAEGEIPVPQRHVEGRMLAAHEMHAARAIGLPKRERQ